MALTVNSKTIETDESGYLLDNTLWTEDIAIEIARTNGITLDETRWELIQYFRDYYDDHMIHPSMNRLLRERELSKGKHFSDAEKYRDYLYELFPQPPGPIPTLCKLAGLPQPVEEIEE